MYFDRDGLFFIEVLWREKYVLICSKIWELITVYCSENAHQLLSILEYLFRYETLLKMLMLYYQDCGSKRKMAVSNLGWKIFLLIKIPDTKGRNKIYLFHTYHRIFFSWRFIVYNYFKTLSGTRSQIWGMWFKLTQKFANSTGWGVCHRLNVFLYCLSMLSWFLLHCLLRDPFLILKRFLGYWN